jgi:hypothetical protein
MFDQRDQARSIASDGVRLDLTAKTHVLADLALRMIRNGESEVDSTTAIAQVGRSLAGLPSTDHQPAEVFRFLLERSGVLREPAADRVDFVHRTFQEYLAAKAAIDGDAIGELAGNAGNDQWGEVVVLAAGQANQAQTAQLLRGLPRRNWRGQQRYGRRVLAVACLQEVRSLDPGLRREVESIIPGLLPSRSMEQAEQLSAAGEPLIPLLVSHWSRDTSKAAETIRAASLIGGTAAMDLIRDVSLQQDDPETDEGELSRAWQYFHADDYAQRVLAPRKIRSLDIGAASYLSALPHVPSVETLIIRHDEDEEGDFDVLTACPRLKKLEVRNYQYSDMSALPLLPILEELQIYDAPALTSLAGIEQQQAVSSLALWNCTQLTALETLNLGPKLHYLALSDFHHLDLSGLNTEELRIIFFFECGDMDMTPLTGVRDLTVYHDKKTKILNAELLGDGSSVRTPSGRLGSLWPFS